MTVSITFAPDVEDRVRLEAAKQSLPVEAYVESVVMAAISASGEANRRARTLAALEAVVEMGSEDEQRETFGYLAQAIDEDRMSDRKLFS